jgi:DEAD/DEAH box helicase domain-containing protein
MPLSDVLGSLRNDPDLRGDFTAWRELEPRPATYADFPPGTDPRLVAALRAHGIERLYSHQAEALAAVLERRDVVVVTPTASGKTLCYNLPVLETILADPDARALYLFPTKALSQDQMQELHDVITRLEVDIKTYTYDGDTPGEVRRKIREAGHVVVTNPDMLHTGILPHHTKWVKLFENLRYVVVDELHQYRGVFGSHVANLFRRLHRVCRFYGSDPVFICCSATIANPAELASRLLGRPVALVDRNGAPRGRKVIAVYNPPVVNRELGIRQSALNGAKKIALKLLEAGVKTIVFAPSRVRVELLLKSLRAAMGRRVGDPERIHGYRGGYLPNERRAVERGLRDGRVLGVVATNALELGIDIGSLEAAVLTGYPGTLASAWQQMGRAGRRQGVALAVIVASSSPLAQYVASNPDYLFDKSPEAGLIDPENLLVRISHLKCGAFELPFREGEAFGPDAQELLELLAAENVLVKAGGAYHWMAEAFPAEAISLRTAAIDNFVVIEQGPKPRVIGEVDRPSAPLLIHDEAIYMHGGAQFHVDRLDWKEKKAYVRRVEVDHYTDANLAVDLEVLEQLNGTECAGATVAHGEVAVKCVATIFKKLKLETNENIGWGQINIPEENRHTTAYWIALGDELVAGLPPSRVQEGLVGLAHLLRHLAPVFLLCDPRDLHEVAQVRSPHTERPTVFVYENQPGGVGLARRLFEVHGELLRAARALASRCDCPAGCPGCVGPGIGPTSSNKQATLLLLERLTHAQP